MRLANLRNPFIRPRPPVPEAPPPEPVLSGPAIADAPAAAVPAVRWTPARIAIADELWGDGFLFPGGDEEVLRLTVPLGMSEASTLLLLGAAAGGAARAVVAGLGAWISGHEADPALVAVAAWRLPRAGKLVAKRASVVPWNPQAPVFRRRGFDHALALEALRGAPGRPVPVADLLLALAGALRPGGHLVLVDVVATGRLDPADPLVRSWAEVEGRAPNLPTEAALTAALTELHFDVRVTEDISARHMRLAVQGWKRLVRDLSAAHPDRSRAAAVVAEAEVWMRRLKLMHAGQVRLVRWDAIGR
jgi:phosphoethanolamine N-methyltransferase